MTNKKAISPVITTILLIMISIAAVAIVATFVIPWAAQIMDEQKCFDAISQIEVDTSSAYTCYYLVDGYAMFNVSVKRGSKSLDIQQFFITAYGDGRSEKFDIINNTENTAEIRMYGVPGDHFIEVPERREMRTYSLNTTLTEVKSAELAPIIKGNVICDAADKPTIEMCVT